MKAINCLLSVTVLASSSVALAQQEERGSVLTTLLAAISAPQTYAVTTDFNASGSLILRITAA